jgi:HEAT repeat protein
LGAEGAAQARAALDAAVADPARRAAALDWLGTHAPEALRPDDAALLTDPDLRVREAAAVALRGADDPALVNAARRALRELVIGTAAERHAGLRAAARLANPTLAPRLLPFLAHEEPETRRLTLLAIAAVPPGLLAPDFLAAPLREALRDPDAGVRSVAEMIVNAECGVRNAE